MCFWIVFSIFASVYTSALAQSQNGGSVHCPVEWTAGNKISLVFLIDESLFPSKCTGGSNREPYFQRKTSASGTNLRNCTVPDITTNCGSFTSGTLGCGCVTKNGSYVVEYNFIAHPDYDGWWSANLECSDALANQLLTFSTTNCDAKKVKEPTTTATPTTTTTGPLECKVCFNIIIVITSSVVVTLTVGTVCVILFFVFGPKKTRILQFMKGKPQETLERLCTEAGKVLKKIDENRTVSIIPFSFGDQNLVLIHSSNLVKLRQAVKEMISALPNLKEVRVPEKDFRMHLNGNQDPNENPGH